MEGGIEEGTRRERERCKVTDRMKEVKGNKESQAKMETDGRRNEEQQCGGEQQRASEKDSQCVNQIETEAKLS